MNETPLSFDEFINFLNKNLGDCNTRSGISKIFSRVMDDEVKEITPESLHNLITECGDNLTLDDVRQMMKKISDPSPDININPDEFYYIMTKKPSDIEILSSATKSTK